MLEIRAGRFAAAERCSLRCAALGAELGDVDAASWHLSHLTAIRWYQGRVAELLPAIRRTADSPTLSPADHSYRSALAVAAAAAGRRDEALGALASTADSVLHSAARSGSWLAAMFGLVEAAHLLGARDDARVAYELLAPYARLPAIAGPAVSCLGSVEQALGLARLTLGDDEGAAAHLGRAVVHNAALGHFPAAILARHRLAAALARSSWPNERVRADREARAARRDGDELGMVLPPASGSGAGRTVVAVPAIARAARDVVASAEGAAGTISLNRQGRHWRLHGTGRAVEVEHCRGMAYLAVLLANPGSEIPALELSGTGPGTPGLDDEQIAVYRHRLELLRREIERCDAVGDQEAGERAHAEQALLLDRLRGALGLASGPADESPSAIAAEERARVAVGKAIRRALARIAEADPRLGATLSAGVSTGRRCAYLP